VDAKSLETHSGRVFVPFPSPLQPVRLIQRRNRFVVDVRRDAGAARHVQTAALPDIFPLHLPNSGRMTELLQPGTLGLAHVEQRRGRGTAGTLLLVQYQGRWVSVDARMPNRLFARCLELKALPPFLGYTEWKAEVSWGQGRVDFLLSPSEEKLPEKRSRELPPCLVETKSCNLVVDSLALFPDAPTARGARHLRELARLWSWDTARPSSGLSNGTTLALFRLMGKPIRRLRRLFERHERGALRPTPTAVSSSQRASPCSTRSPS